MTCQRKNRQRRRRRKWSSRTRPWQLYGSQIIAQDMVVCSCVVRIPPPAPQKGDRGQHRRYYVWFGHHRGRERCRIALRLAIVLGEREQVGKVDGPAGVEVARLPGRAARSVVLRESHQVREI